ncbi:hypothetical protein MAPG_00842 [Magnaporthiopsis poae ATCC 64411]|uniref:Tat pathway signal sequence n=1 Tax=Magnaporthiopsis poae (strain ATCC 64411 / 73-15) TaxID=644358 RepID=A0A0C4DM42_MAGP6|nr:hypothetical protein MAPG_00842 [Magnaporthiopsis poae ATCC 64411]
MDVNARRVVHHDNSPAAVSADTKQASRLSYLLEPQSIEKLEERVKIGVDLLNDLRMTVTGLNTESGQRYLDSIGKLLQTAKVSQLIVGVHGATGVGKSSVLNAILGEERLLPTSCARACTAAATEISYNESDDPSEAYRAEIEFITTGSWEAELRTLLGDLRDDDSNALESPGNNVKAALAKIRAVYPGMDSDQLQQSNLQDLVMDPAVSRYLDSTVEISNSTADGLATEIQAYVDSNNRKSRRKKVNESEDDQLLPSPTQMELWPLVSRVRIFTKASVLETGAVLVDLPGVQDSNSARAAVSARYAKLCSAMWIVAPITRAVSDKVAEKLLGRAFRRQLQFDGTYSATTFICSKTDDILVTEAEDAFGLQEDLAEMWDRKEEIAEEIEITKDKIKKSSVDRDAATTALHNITKDITTWQGLGIKLAKGHTVYAPDSRPGRKRKSTSGETREQQNDPRPLTESNVMQMLDSLEQRSSEVSDSKMTHAMESASLNEELQTLHEEDKTLDIEMKTVCIKGRNQYSRRRIQRHFAQGIKELDQEALHEIEEPSHLHVCARDYDAVAKSLPVFCVSARAYQHLCGFLKKDKFQASAFANEADTEIPSLQEHGRTLSQTSRISQCHHFLSGLVQVINSLRIWTSPRMTGQGLITREEEALDELLDKAMDDLSQASSHTIKTCTDAILDTLSELIVKTFRKAIPGAARQAIEESRAWGDYKSIRGMFWATFRATARRGGVFTGRAGPRNLNMDLLGPIMDPLAPVWEDAFQRRVPRSLEAFVKAMQDDLKISHTKLCKEAGIPQDTQITALLTEQIELHIRDLSRMPARINKIITPSQREINRNPEPVIKEAMRPAYEDCSEVTGVGSYKRMKGIIINHVEDVRHNMFDEACETMEKELKDLVDAVGAALEQEMESIFHQVKMDYKAALVEHHAECCGKVLEILNGIDARFAKPDPEA